MNHRRFYTVRALLVTCAAAWPLAIAGCSGESNGESGRKDVTAEDVRKEATEAAKTAGAFARSTVDDYKQKMRDAISGLNNDIEHLQARAASMTGQAKAHAEEWIESLRTQRDAFAARIDETVADSASAWEEVKNGLDQAWKDLDEARKAALNQFGKDEE